MKAAQSARTPLPARRDLAARLGRAARVCVAGCGCAMACPCVEACSSGAAQTPPLPVTIGVESDPGVMLAGAKIALGDKTLGITGSDGTARLALGGHEGESFDLSIHCPDGYRSPAVPVTVTLRRLADPGRTPLYKSSCKPLLRNVVVAVTAEHGTNLPVVYLGSEVARTDASGAAHVLLKIAPGEQFSLTLETSGKDADALRPRNPVATFTVSDHDEVFVFDPHFTVQQEKQHRVPARGPTELGH